MFEFEVRIETKLDRGDLCWIASGGDGVRGRGEREGEVAEKNVDGKRADTGSIVSLVKIFGSMLPVVCK